MAAATTRGTLEFVAVHRGHVQPLSATVTFSVQVHQQALGGVRWLGPNPRVVSYACDRLDKGWVNNVYLTDVRTCRTVKFRCGGERGWKNGGGPTFSLQIG